MAAIVQAFEADRIELHLQPIVTLPQRKVRSTRRSPACVSPTRASSSRPSSCRCSNAGYSAEFDRRVLGRTLAVARHLMARGSEAIVSINIAPKALEEPGFLRSLARVFDAYPDTIGRIVLELSQRCWRTLDVEQAGALAVLRDRGSSFALDRAADLGLDPLALADRGVRFVKLPADLLIAADQGRGLDIEAADLASVLRRAGIKLIAEKVERGGGGARSHRSGYPAAGGFVFAAPRAVRSEVLSGAAQAMGPLAAPEPATPAPATEPPARTRRRRRSAPSSAAPVDAPLGGLTGGLTGGLDTASSRAYPSGRTLRRDLMKHANGRPSPSWTG